MYYLYYFYPGLDGGRWDTGRNFHLEKVSRRWMELPREEFMAQG